MSNTYKMACGGGADVFYPRDNGLFTQFTLRYLHDWYRAVLRGIMPDIVHFNCGLWDVLRLSNEQDTFNSVESYVNLLGRIVQRIWFLSPQAKIIFATTTPVIEPGFTPGTKYGSRKNTDIKRFNVAAVDYFQQDEFRGAHHVTINDLWLVASKLTEEAHSDDVHYDTNVGRAALGRAVIQAIEPFL